MNNPTTDSHTIRIEGATENNLRSIDLELPLGAVVVVTGVSGSGKSSLAFDTIYAEGQRRYVETFSPYTRQFLDRMDKPRVERITGIPPAIAIDQTNPVRTSRSTVGTMTEINDHLKLLFPRIATLHCGECGRRVGRDDPDDVAEKICKDHHDRFLVAFPLSVPERFNDREVEDLLRRLGYRGMHRRHEDVVEVIQDRLAVREDSRPRIVEDVEAAYKNGTGTVAFYPVQGRDVQEHALRFSADLHCPHCDLHYRDPAPNMFSFNSPIGACDTCRGFGRVIGVDYGLVIPDGTKTLADGAIRPWQTKSYRECQDDLIRFAKRRGVPITVSWDELSDAQKQWVIEGEGDWNEGVWYGVARFFKWLESRAYKMHIRVLLSKYRAYHLCHSCRGARLKPESLLWTIDDQNVHSLTTLPIDQLALFVSRVADRPQDDATRLVLDEIGTRLQFLVEVGLEYLTLDRQSRTLSGGEVQRINLTTALGTSLTNTLFVLDEPSIGLHSRDIRRLIRILKRLRDSGNTLIVVEHDPEVISAADMIVDMGPGAGRSGGRVVFQGSPRELQRNGRTLTAQYLRGEKSVVTDGSHERTNRRKKGGARTADSSLTLLDAECHNLRIPRLEIPLRRLVSITGVSGSGKSTLLEDVLYRGLRRKLNLPTEAPGEHRDLRGHEAIAEVILVDQSAIGKTARSNPASFVGAFDGIRKRFAAAPLSRARGYTAGTFSFNSGNGRCPTCKGTGFEHVEMQFLSDVYLRCPDCDGRRYRKEILDVQLDSADGGVSIADVLELTVAQATELFADDKAIIRALNPLLEVGLDYVQLGQPVPTLSGGEAQRLKLASHLAGKGRYARKPCLFLFDEPTTGLHFDDIATLMRAFRKLVDSGHSLLVIEHNLDVIRGSDWVIDLGPGAGEHGGRVVCTGTPKTLRETKQSHTGHALAAYESVLGGNRDTDPRLSPNSNAAPDSVQAHPEGFGDRQDIAAEEATPYAASRPTAEIRIQQAREHNLRNIDVSVPQAAFSVITGVSGSGKSTLAFDILFSEGQRRYLESLNAYARQFVQPATRPDVDSVQGVPPTVAIEQRTSRGGRKSTVATMTEVYHFIRLLFVKLGVQHCPDCRVAIRPQDTDSIVAGILRQFSGSNVRILAPLVVARKGYYTDLAKWARGKGYKHLRVDRVDTPTDVWPRLDRYQEHDIDAPVGTVVVNSRTESAIRDLLTQALRLGDGRVRVAGSEELLFSTRRACPQCGRSFDDLDPRLFSYNSKHGWCPACFGTGEEIEEFDEEDTGAEDSWLEEGEHAVCRTCNGARLRPEALAVLFHDMSIAQITANSVEQASDLFARIDLSPREVDIGRDILVELENRLSFLREVGLGYLTLDRSAPSLSGGEAQRIRLASQLGSNLRGVCYILDEPTIGLHARDNGMLLDALNRLKTKGNTIVVVEHDEETIRHADHVIDLGPGGGVRGGRLVAFGTPSEIAAHPHSATGKFLREKSRRTQLPSASPQTTERDSESPSTVSILGATLHNLQGIDVGFPLGRMICVTGVSGSGKSTLVRGVLSANLKSLVGGKHEKAESLQGCRSIEGFESVDRVLEVDQTPIGKTPRSCPATYVGFWDEVRDLFASLPESRVRGYSKSRFSFNTPGGRCEECKGQGVKKIEMSFLPDVKVLCESCNGRRFSEETLKITYRGKTIADVLEMSVDEAVGFFDTHVKIYHSLKLLQEVGVGYLALGQPSPTLSGGEAQRAKLVTELVKAWRVSDKLTGGKSVGRGRRNPHTVYILDEPTIGLHMADVRRLTSVFRRLLAAGNTIVIIEHNLDLIAEADWVIDLGPEGGAGGGAVVAAGPPWQLARNSNGSHTARYLEPLFELSS